MFTSLQSYRRPYLTLIPTLALCPAFFPLTLNSLSLTSFFHLFCSIRYGTYRNVWGCKPFEEKPIDFGSLLLIPSKTCWQVRWGSYPHTRLGYCNDCALKDILLSITYSTIQTPFFNPPFNPSLYPLSPSTPSLPLPPVVTT